MKNQMTKFATAFAVISITLLGSGCSIEAKITSKPEITNKPKTTPAVDFSKAIFEGHDYVIWRNAYHNGGITHSPDCACGK